MDVSCAHMQQLWPWLNLRAMFPHPDLVYLNTAIRVGGNFTHE